jgi:hypothetical protein
LPKANEKLRKIVLLLITWGVLLGFFIGYENYFVAGQQEYLIDQEFRNLSRLSAQLNAQFDRARLSVSSLARIMHSTPEKPASTSPELDCRIRKNITGCFEAYSKDYLPKIWDGKVPTEGQLLCLGNDRETIRLQAELEVAGLHVAVYCPQSVLPQTSASLHPMTARTGAGVPAQSNSNAAPSGAASTPMLRLDMSPWVRSAFEEYKNTFDDLLVADEFGHVLLQQSANGPRIADLRPLLEGGLDISIKPNAFGFLNATQAASSSAKSGDANSSNGSGSGSSESNKDAAPPLVKLERLSHGSSATRISLSGHTYFLFAQPTKVVMGNVSEQGATWPLVLVGLRLASGISAESHALPYSVLIWLALSAAVLLGFSWPWFKLQYMSNTERFRPRDGWVLLFTLLLVSAGVMLILLNGSYLLRSRDATDQALRSIAKQMKHNFLQETNDAFHQLQELRKTPEFQRASSDPNVSGLEGSFPIQKYRKQPYPYFEIAFWANCQGEQLAKVDIRKVATPTINLNKPAFLFYQVVKAKMDWDEDNPAQGKPTCPPASENQDSWEYSFFQPVQSPNTNEFAPVLSAPFHRAVNPTMLPGADAGNKLAIQALVFRPMSVIDPVLPPGYGFAVIDGKCNVLFDSDSFRDLRENFCEESKDKSELYPWLVSGVDTPLNISYGGREKRAFLTNFRFPGLSAGQPVYLLVFQEADQQLTLDLAIILVCTICLLFYFLVLALFAAGHLVLRGPFHWHYAPHIIWPCPKSGVAYAEIFVSSLLLSLLYHRLYRGLHEAPLIAFTLGLAVLATLFAILRLRDNPSRVLWRYGISAASLAVLSEIFIACLRLSYGKDLSPSASAGMTEWSKLLCLPLLGGIIAAFFAPPIRPMPAWTKFTPEKVEAARHWLRRHFNLAYSLALVSLMVCTSLVPCAGFFKYAYDEVSQLALKHDEAVLADRLLQRRDRIARFYGAFPEQQQVADDRLALLLDRYDQGSLPYSTLPDGHFFDTCNEPGFRSRNDDLGCPPPDKENPVDLGLNDWIEKHIARATLTFPSNDLGSEMSRLGVAETDVRTSWERYWLEPGATTFILSWKRPSRAPGFMVWAGYPEAHGLMIWARIVLIVFVGIMLVWLNNLSKIIFLTNLQCAPTLEEAQWKSASDIKRDTLVIGLPRSGKSAQLRKLPGLDPSDFRDLRDLQTGDPSDGKIAAVESTNCLSGVIVLDQFDFNMRDPDWNQKRLALLERLSKYPDQILVLVSTVDPMYFLAAERDTVLCPGKDAAQSSLLLDRWARALDKFAHVKLPNTREKEFCKMLDEYSKQGEACKQFADWIEAECKYTPMLQRVGVALLEKFPKEPPHTRVQLIDMVVDRADAYYRMLWAGLTGSERLVLYQLALDGWANPKNAPAIHQLEQKGLICRNPMYQIMNDSFRDFIRTSEHQQEIQEWQKKEQQSAWQGLRFVLLAAIIGVGVWLLYAQAQLFQIGVGYITAIATLLTAVAGFTAKWKRSPVAPPTDPSTDS